MKTSWKMTVFLILVAPGGIFVALLLGIPLFYERVKGLFEKAPPEPVEWNVSDLISHIPGDVRCPYECNCECVVRT